MSHSPDGMHQPMEPLQRLPQQPLISPTGARLVLDNTNTGYLDCTDSSSPGRGRWFDIASTDTKTFLQAGNNSDDAYVAWLWPAVVLTPEEYKLRVGGMSVTELRSQLEKYWGWVQEYGILPHSRTYYCLLFSLYHMFIVFVISY